MDSQDTETCPHCDETIDGEAEACPACGHLFEAISCERHPDREAEGHCVICGTAVCDECNHPQARHYACERHATVLLVSGWAQIYSTSDDLEAELIRDNLVAEGVEARVLSQKDHFTFNVDLGELSNVRVLVPAYDYEVAEGMIATHLDTSGEVAFACPNCGEAFDQADTVCSTCGQELPRLIEPDAQPEALGGPEL